MQCLQFLLQIAFHRTQKKCERQEASLIIVTCLPAGYIILQKYKFNEGQNGTTFITFYSQRLKKTINHRYINTNIRLVLNLLKCGSGTFITNLHADSRPHPEVPLRPGLAFVMLLLGGRHTKFKQRLVVGTLEIGILSK